MLQCQCSARSDCPEAVCCKRSKSRLPRCLTSWAPRGKGEVDHRLHRWRSLCHDSRVLQHTLLQMMCTLRRHQFRELELYLEDQV